jgi:hypothetical protein
MARVEETTRGGLMDGNSGDGSGDGVGICIGDD